MSTTQRPAARGYTRFSTVNEVAAMLRVSHMTVRRLIENEGFPAFRVGTAIRIPTAAVWAYLETTRVDPSWAAQDSVPAPALAPTA